MAIEKLWGFIKGLSLKNNYMGDWGLQRVQNFKLSDRQGVLVSRGGFDDWDAATQNYSYLLGSKRWYREDGGSNFFFVATNGAGDKTPRIFSYTLSNKTSQQVRIITGNVNYQAPVLWVDCGDQLLVLPLTSTERPISIKLSGLGFGTKPLGLDPGTVVPSVVTAFIFAFPFPAVKNAIELGTYQYRYSYSYGTRAEPEKYGESALSSVVTAVNLTDPSGANYNGSGIIQLNGFTPVGDATLPFVTRINIYRTLKNTTGPYYRVGRIEEPGRTNYNDTTGDSLVDTSQTSPTLSGLPTAMRCAMWHPTLQRLFWFGEDGFFHWSAAGFPDICPTQNKIAVGDTGYKGNGLFLIRNNIYAFKEDGIFLIEGTSPNYTSQKITHIQCFARAGFAHLVDGVYFPGVEGSEVKVFKFDGVYLYSNKAVPVSGDIDSIIPKNRSYFFMKLFGKKVGNEYWMSIISTENNLVDYPGVPWNNLILVHDVKSQSWSTIKAQASSIEVFDGPGDAGELFITESNWIGNDAVGNFFRFEPNGVTYNGDTRTQYSRINPAEFLITVGPLKAKNGYVPGNTTLERLSPQRARVRYKWNWGILPGATLYDDSDALQQILLDNIVPEPLIKFATGPSKFGTAKFGTDKFVITPYEEALFQVKPPGPTLEFGLGLDISFIPGLNHKDPAVIEAIEIEYSPSKRG